jgi:hypothetical protein
VDLINVAFAPPKKVKPNLDLTESWFTPDRLSGLEAWQELRSSCPRDWRFVEVNITYEVSFLQTRLSSPNGLSTDYQECQEHRQSVIDLMYPSSTGMHVSLEPH